MAADGLWMVAKGVAIKAAQNFLGSYYNTLFFNKRLREINTIHSVGCAPGRNLAAAAGKSAQPLQNPAGAAENLCRLRLQNAWIPWVSG